jgi:hypothetical protein
LQHEENDCEGEEGHEHPFDHDQCVRRMLAEVGVITTEQDTVHQMLVNEQTRDEGRDPQQRLNLRPENEDEFCPSEQ